MQITHNGHTSFIHVTAVVKSLPIYIQFNILGNKQNRYPIRENQC